MSFQDLHGTTYPGPNRAFHRARRRRGFCSLRHRQPSWSTQTSTALPAGRFFPLNSCKSNRVTAGLNGAPSKLLASTPEQMGFPHVVQLARVDSIRQLSPGRQEVETIWLITGLMPGQADAARLLQLARQYWTTLSSSVKTVQCCSAISLTVRKPSSTPAAARLVGERSHAN